MISIMEAFMHKLKSSVSAVSAPVFSQRHCLSLSSLCVCVCVSFFFFFFINHLIIEHGRS